ncbi:Polymerase/histidinol phosphatase-like [Acididesulfobacillus acetoxydans]|uniref:DNA helicase II n=1 Tax=Acididesulfobacillus acetoxydans TaxID=1561005 RepID=A0A8S0WPQ5_9FIRM|nr:endonuclease Q family protein [Acididesulfobacillus acetoxydans]CAA7602094.1 Polymerase/histidinol phosphatase-like [Acididesulfobacillus acetoxydans]CEJ08063.1 DNA helicase II [Acididesulfobacillus acetoxydans]
MIYADMHIHIGRSLDGKAVKITAAASLDLPRILEQAGAVKGLSLIGIVDAHSTGVRRDFETLLAEGILRPLAGGGYRAGELTVIPGVEAELAVGGGAAHLLAYFPGLAEVGEYVRRLRPYVKNWQLSSQKAFLPVKDWLDAVLSSGGVWLPAHAFTPHKGIYGNCCRRLAEVLPELPRGLEIGLSADRQMARSISELDGVELFSNSDAHSLPNIAREYNALQLSEASFAGWQDLLARRAGRVAANYGLNPEVGKYHRSFCLICEKVVEGAPPAFVCPRCGSEHVVPGVLDRLVSIADRAVASGVSAAGLPEAAGGGRYVYQIPLRRLPGIGPKTIERLLGVFGTEMAVLHEADPEDLMRVAGEKAARWILGSRRGELRVEPGGGGIFGRVVDILS